MKYKIRYKNKYYIVKAKDTQSALLGLSVVAPDVEDDRLSPMTYKKLKELGYGHEQWKDLSQEEANKIVQTNSPESKESEKSNEVGGGNGSGGNNGNGNDEEFTKSVKSYNDSLLSKYKLKESDLKKPKHPLTIKGGDVLWGLIRSGADISIDDIKNHPLIKDAAKKLNQKKGAIKKVNIDGKEIDVGENETILIDTPERKKLRQQIADKISSQGSIVVTTDENGKSHTSYSGPVAKNHRAEIVIGVPAGGKSSVIVDKVSQNTQSRVLDSDDVKKELPEFDSGNGAELVHKESADDILTKRIIPQFMKGGKHNGENIIIPIVGKNPNAAKKYLKALKDAGYDVHLSFNDVTPTNSAKRATTRFLETGRFLSPDYIDSIGTKPQTTYEELKNGVDGIHFDSFSRYNNNVKFGEPPEKIEHLDKNKKNVKWEDWR